MTIIILLFGIIRDLRSARNMQIVPDKLLINLKILSKIQKNGRITRSYDGIISLEQESMYQPIKRFLASDSRKQAVFEINSIVTECIDTLYGIINSKFMHKNYHRTDEYAKHYESLELLLHEMVAAKCGIANLKFTYQNDPNVLSQLDIISLKIETTVRDCVCKKKALACFLPDESITEQGDTVTETQPTQSARAGNDENYVYDLQSIRVEAQYPYDVSMTEYP